VRISPARAQSAASLEAGNGEAEFPALRWQAANPRNAKHKAISKRLRKVVKFEIT
jgi:hypothetical protein